jgi:hypothetical protein
MAETDAIIQVGGFAPQDGEYRHSVCAVATTLRKGNRIPPCYSRNCPKKDADWFFTEETPTETETGAETEVTS